MCPRPLKRRDRDPHSQRRTRRRRAKTLRDRARRQHRLSGHPPTSAAVGLLALINHTVRRGSGRKERERSAPLPQVVATLTARPLLGGEERRAASLPPFFFFFFFLGFELRRWHRQYSTPMGFGERGTKPRNGAGRPALSACLHRRGGGTDRVTRPLSYGPLRSHRH